MASPSQLEQQHQQIVKQEIPPEQKKFLELLNEMMQSIHEVVYTSNLIEGSMIQQHPELQDLVDAIKHLGRVAWEFQKLAKRMASGGKQ